MKEERRQKVRMICTTANCTYKSVRYLRFDILKDYICHGCKKPLSLLRGTKYQLNRDQQARKDLAAFEG